MLPFSLPLLHPLNLFCFLSYKIVEESQSRFMTAGSAVQSLKSGNTASTRSSSVSGHYSPISSYAITPTTNGYNRVRSSCSAESAYTNSNESNVAAGITNSCHDFVDDDYDDAEIVMDKVNSIVSDNDNDGDDDDELADTSISSTESFDINLDFEPMKVNFPEAGVDLVDQRIYSSIESDLSQDSGIKLINNNSTWQDNWLFKKHKENRSYHQYHLNSDIHYGYMALALSDPVPMLIPNPSQPFEGPMIGDSDIEQVSDLSEHNSETGSIEDLFSDLEEEEEDDNDNEEVKSELQKLKSSTEDVAGRKIGSTLPKIMINVNVSKEALRDIRNQIKLKRWSKIKVPEFVPPELRTICNSIPNSHHFNLECVPSITLKPGNATIHSGIVAQYCVKANGMLPIYFAWYKDGQLIACSDDCAAAESSISMEDNDETKCKQVARIYFGIRRPIYRRTVETRSLSTSPYRLIVFNENECILEMKRTTPTLSGSYSVVAYSHAGYDWTDFVVNIDRTHFSATIPTTTVSSSPRPIRRRPQNKPRKVYF